MTEEIILKKLTELADSKYKSFSAKLTPSVKSENVLGVKMPSIRKLAREIADNEAIEGFLCNLPHRYLEQNNLHACLIECMADFDKAISYTQKFLPFIDNWATCDMLFPKAFKRNPEKLLPYIEKWLNSSHVYTVRFAVNMLMRLFLDERFDLKFAERIAKIESDEYYLKMVIAWYFATALAKQYDSVLPFLTQKKLSVWIHNKTIQKAVESYRITQEQKIFLKTLKIR